MNTINENQCRKKFARNTGRMAFVDNRGHKISAALPDAIMLGRSSRGSRKAHQLEIIVASGVPIDQPVAKESQGFLKFIKNKGRTSRAVFQSRSKYDPVQCELKSKSKS